jgi:hypothetical protein
MKLVEIKYSKTKSPKKESTLSHDIGASDYGKAH